MRCALIGTLRVGCREPELLLCVGGTLSKAASHSSSCRTVLNMQFFQLAEDVRKEAQFFSERWN